MPRHPFDALSLVLGVIFAAVAALAFVGPTDQIIDPRWVGPAILVIIGLVLLAPRRSRRISPNQPGDIVDESHDGV